MTKNTYSWQVLITTSFGVILVMLNMSTVNVALPEIVAHFRSGPIASSWILLSYMLFNTILILIFGRLADVYGRRKLYLIGISGFTITSLFCGFAPNVWILIALRILQAACGALVVTNTTPMLTDVFSKERLGTALGINVLVSSSAQLLGPVVGGYFVHTLDWRWVFWFNVPIGIIGFIWALLILRPIEGRAKGEKIDILGSIFVLAGLGGLIFAFSRAGTLGWVNSSVVTGLGLFVIAGVFFLIFEKKTKFPIVDFSLFKNRTFAIANIANFLNSFARSSTVLLIALFFQLMHEQNTFVAGLFVLPVTGGMIIASSIVGFLDRKFSTWSLSTSGLVCSAVGILLLIFNTEVDSSTWCLLIGQFLIGFGSGIFMTPNTGSIMLTVPPEKRGLANGLRSMLQNMGMVISTALSLMLVTLNLPDHLKNAIYAGANSQAEKTELSIISDGFQLAFEAMFFITLLAIFVSSLRKGKEGKKEVKNTKKEIEKQIESKATKAN